VSSIASNKHCCLDFEQALNRAYVFLKSGIKFFLQLFYYFFQAVFDA
jgi:hypothetical protein